MRALFVCFVGAKARLLSRSVEVSKSPVVVFTPRLNSIRVERKMKRCMEYETNKQSQSRNHHWRNPLALSKQSTGKITRSIEKFVFGFFFLQSQSHPQKMCFVFLWSAGRRAVCSAINKRPVRLFILPLSHSDTSPNRWSSNTYSMWGPRTNEIINWSPHLCSNTSCSWWESL